MADKVVRTMTPAEDQLHRYGFYSNICVAPVLFGKDPDFRATTWRMSQWCQKNLHDLWEVNVTRRPLWTRDCAYFEVLCLSKAEMDKVDDFFKYPQS